jgi:hypothetical protein
MNPADAFIRAAKVSPLYRRYALFKSVLDGKGRIDPGLYDWFADAHGSLRWKDVDNREGNPIVGSGEGVVTLLGDFPERPNLIHSERDGWLMIQTALERDALGAGYRFTVRAWADPCLPRIRAGAP